MSTDYRERFIEAGVWALKYIETHPTPTKENILTEYAYRVLFKRMLVHYIPENEEEAQARDTLLEELSDIPDAVESTSHLSSYLSQFTQPPPST